MVASFVWTIPPSVMVGKLESYRERIVQALHMLADTFAARMEAMAKSLAPWNDQTGLARASLRGFAEKAALGVVIYLAHSVHYGRWLELGSSRMAPRPAIMPTLNATYAPLMAQVRALVGA